MLKYPFKAGFGFALLASTCLIATSADAGPPYFTGPTGSNPANQPANIPDYNTIVGYLNSSASTGINPQTMAAYATVRNYLDNGAFSVAQRGTSALAGSTTGGCVGKNPPGLVNGYVGDRWCVNTNVGSGAGKGQVVTATPTPLQGFADAHNVWRDSGTLTQTVCAIQEVPTNDSKQLQGQQVTFSAWLQALAGLNADNGSIVTMNLITGTGADEGLGSVTSSPAITPAWTGIATQTATNGTTKTKTITTGWVRYSVNYTIPTTATEVGVEICFHPAKGTTGSSSDGFSMEGVQLEVGNTPSSYEFKPLGLELAKAQQYFLRVNETTTTGNLLPFQGFAITSQNCTGVLEFPVAMRVAPLYTNQLTATTFGVVGSHVAIKSGVALTSTFSGPVAVNNPTSASLTFLPATGSNILNGDMCELQSEAGGGVLDFSADF